ncbi:lyase family protein [Candidatus Karelsulcia muelleri]|uniref:lyase family protein n=1 Tax=Candidatus Karelsulcia muelleri TaxID=336810 RepID=UPI000D7C53B5|nr:lyase family protein [Candidatus Karelsulcia muelleri]
MTFRIEKDSLGTIEVSNQKYWGAQTERSKINFKIGKKDSMPIEIIYGLAYIKKAAAITNSELGFLSKKKKKIITKVCDEILEGKLNNNFPLVIWQTGSGTQTNININEVISNRAHVLSGKKLGEGISSINPNDDVNKSQSYNDAFTTALYIASYKILIEKTIPGIKKLRNYLKLKSFDYKNIIKIGRTHLDPSLGQEFSAYVSQLDKVIKELKNIINNILELAIVNVNCLFSLKVVNYISNLTGFEFKTAKNKFSDSHETIVITHGILKNLAISLFKISNDMMSYVIGDGEIIIPSPSGKINPTQCEALCMVSIKVIGNDTTISIASGSGVCKPVIGSNFLESAKLIGEACFSFSKNCISGINPNLPRIKKLLNQSLNEFNIQNII